MALSIHTNTSSLTAQRNLTGINRTLETTVQRLSTGLRINSAKDDAAGLAIASRFFSQANGLSVAARNTNDGISMMQTADGNLGKITDMLQRMRGLAVQSANASNSANDRSNLQTELGQLLSEVDRIAKTTAFNQTKLLDGSFSGAYFQVGANSGDNITIGTLVNAQKSALSKVTYGYSLSAAINPQEVTNYNPSIAAGELKMRVGNKAPISLGAIEAASSGTQRIGQVVAAINNQSPTTGVSAIAERNADGTYQLQVRSTSDDTVLFEGFNRARTGFGAETWVGLTDPDSDYVPDKNVLDGMTNVASFQALIDTSNGNPLKVWGAFQDFRAGLADSQAMATMTAGINAYFSAVNPLIQQTGPGQYDIANTASNLATLTQARDALRGAFDLAAWQEGSYSRGRVSNAATSLIADPNMYAWNVNELNGALTAVDARSGNVQTAISTAASGVTASTLNDVRKTIVGLVDTVMSGGIGIQAEETTQQQGLDALDISTQSGAWAAMLKLDSAMDQVSAARGAVGAWQSRFAYAVSNIDSQQESASTARGRIVDADFAQEALHLVRTQILQKAGAFMVAQANQMQRNVLSVLTGSNGVSAFSLKA